MTGTERKVFQKYYPPDYDPRKLPRVKGGKPKQFVQRIMAPFNMTCNTCGEYIYQGKKFNMRRETAENEFYLGLKIFRFYFRCPNCLAEITFKTDLENCDYQAEHGSTRLFEARKVYQEKKKEEEQEEEETKSNRMKMLEKRTKMSRAEMEALSQLEDIREQNRMMASLDYVKLLDEYRAAEKAELERQEREDEEFVQRLFKKPLPPVKEEMAGATQEDVKPFGPIIKRLDDSSSGSEEDEDIGDDPSGLVARLMGRKQKRSIEQSSSGPSTSTASTSAQQSETTEISVKGTAEMKAAKRSATSQRDLLLKGVVVKKPKASTTNKEGNMKTSQTNASKGLVCYGSDSD